MDDAGPEAQRILQMFEDDAFVETSNDNYARIEEVARDLGLVGR
jgi:ABC-type phosphate/phosphonate transport system substrate-binding protein